MVYVRLVNIPLYKLTSNSSTSYDLKGNQTFMMTFLSKRMEVNKLTQVCDDTEFFLRGIHAVLANEQPTAPE